MQICVILYMCSHTRERMKFTRHTHTYMKIECKEIWMLSPSYFAQIHKHTQTHTHTHAHTHTHTHARTHTCVYTYVCVLHICKFLHACHICKYLHVCIFITVTPVHESCIQTQFAHITHGYVSRYPDLLFEGPN